MDFCVTGDGKTTGACAIVYKKKSSAKEFLGNIASAIPLAAWYGWTASSQWPALLRSLRAYNPASAGILFYSRTLACLAVLIFLCQFLLLMLLRDPVKQRINGLFPRLAAIAGTYFSGCFLLLPGQQVSTVVAIISSLLIVVGIVFASYSLIWLGRSISITPQVRHLITTGPYSFVRHPVYLGEGVALFGTTLMYAQPEAGIVFMIYCWLQLLRIHYEEKILEDVFPQYAGLRQRTSVIIPYLY